MSGDKKPDHYQAERQDATQQNSGVDDAVNKAVNISPGMLSSPGGFGNTSFEGYDLNAMIDIVEGASPETLESAATALVDARDAINDAADELSRNLGNVDWEGEAHTAFYTWGMNLTTTALELASYTDEVGTQVLAASSGLASVRKSMPPRDSRIVPKKVDDIPTPQRVEGNAEYTAAVKAEKDRQEAINQMYRLASFYTVSSGMMEMAKEPVFPEMPSVGVPAPPPGFDPREEQPRQPGTLQSVSDTAAPRHQSLASEVERPRSEDLTSARKNGDEAVRLPEQHVGTEIDSVGTLPPQDLAKPTTVVPPSTAGPGATPAGSVPSFVSTGVPPTFRGPAGRSSGFGGVPANRLPTSAQGRAGGMPGGIGAGRTGTGPMGQVGRAATAGKSGSRIPGPVGRGVVGGAPKPIGQSPGRAVSGPRGPVTGTGAMNPGRPGGAGRSGAGRVGDGVVGGRPVTAGPAGSRNSKLPRGTVVGGEGASTSRAAGERPGQRGVVGAPRSAAGPAAGQTARRPVGSPDGVVGTPQGRVSGSRNGGSPSGGRGAARGAAGNQGSSEKRSRRDERRDDASATD
ncbi:WXG100 family type VII secretion target [Streptomyces sp. Root264]|uniref:WXG100 family type VII secretion target n=1 Tax=Streptomyces sp. Root264 TaxID=1736503 RepID=UPI000A92978D|nr:WXG100 family type VII secretion target [Streptomyces sp. Root264]